MQDNVDPIAFAEKELQARIRQWAQRAADFGFRYVTLGLIKVLGPTVVAAVLAVVSFPAAAAVACVLAFALLAAHAVYATRLLKRQDSQLRWAWVANYRLRQRALALQIATDNATLALLGERSQPSGPYQRTPQELRAAVAFLNRKLHDAESRAEAAEAVKPGKATDAQRRTLRRADAAPAASPPDMKPIKARREARRAEYAEMEATIQSLATPGDVERAKAAEEATRTRRERQDAATAADKEARERNRRGQTPTAEKPGQTFQVGMKPNGEREVSTRQGSLTPEQIARGAMEGEKE